jgi:hypothetical protein
MPRILRLPQLRLGEDVDTINHLGSLQAFHVLSGHKPSGFPFADRLVDFFPFQQLAHGALLPGNRRTVSPCRGMEPIGPVRLNRSLKGL